MPMILEPPTIESAERDLWAAVLTQAVLDALSSPTGNAEKAEANHARAFMRGTTPDFAQVCELAGLEPDAVREAFKKRLAEHLSPKPTAAPVRKREPLRYEHDGKSLTLREWSEATGVPFARLHARVRVYGWPFADALTTPKGKDRPGQSRSSWNHINSVKRAIRHEHDGLRLTMAEWAERTGVSTACIYARIKKGWPKGAALTAPSGTTLAEFETLKAMEAFDPEELTDAEAQALAQAQDRAQLRGVASDFEPLLGTGGRTLAQETPEIAFAEATP